MANELKIWDTNTSSWVTVAYTGAKGDVGMSWEGAWDSGTSYQANDVVEHDGSCYICILESTDNEPPNATHWEVLAEKGDKGGYGGGRHDLAWGLERGD